MGMEARGRRWPGRGRLAGGLLLLGLTAVAEPRLSVSLSVAPEVPCVTARSLQAGLSQEGLTLVESGGLDVDVSASAPGLRLRARRQDDGRLIVRGIPAGPGACNGVERALVTLIREWASTPRLATPERRTARAPGVDRTRTEPSGDPAGPSPAEDSPAPPPPPVRTDDATRTPARPEEAARTPARPDEATRAPAASPEPPSTPPIPRRGGPASAPTRRAGDGAIAQTRPAAGPPEPPVLAAEPASTPAPVTAATSAVAVAEPTPEAPPVTAISDEPRPTMSDPARPWHIRLAVAGGVAGAATPVVPAGVVTLDVGSGALGVALDGSIEGQSTRSVAPGQLSASFQWLALTARWRFTWLDERLALDAGLGARASHLAAGTSGFTTNRSLSLWSFGPTAVLTLWVRVVGPIHLMFRGLVSYRLPEDRLEVTNGPSFTVGPWQLGSVGGVAVAWP